MHTNDYLNYLGNCACFYDAAKTLNETMKTALHDNAKLARLLVSSSVNYAFACELALKAILLKNDINYHKQHELNVLMELLPITIKNLFFSALSLRFNIEIKLVKQQIMSISSTFVEWRYFAFNHKSLNLNYEFLVAFSELVCQYAFKIESKL